jgi:hypothetical protein
VTTTLLVTFVAPEASMMLNKVLMSVTTTVIIMVSESNSTDIP